LSDIANLNTEATKQICDFVKNDATILIGLISATPEKHKWSYEELEITKIELKHLNSIEKLNYIKKSFLHNGLKIANDKICQIIFNLANSDIDQIDQYVQLITLYAEEGSLITEEMIRILYPENLESDEFKFIQVIAKGNYYQIAHYVTILQQTQANFFGLVGLLFKNYSQLHQIAHLQSLHLSTNDIAKQIGSPPWLVEKHLKILNSYKNEINFLPHLLRIMQSSLELRSKSLPHSELMLDLALYLRPKSVNDGANGSRLSKI
jgi:DNA polymerase III delta subunit